MLPQEPATSDKFYPYEPLQEVAVAQAPLLNGGALVAIRGLKTIIMLSRDVESSDYSLNDQIIIDYTSTPVQRFDSMQYEYAKGKAKQLAEIYNVPVETVATKKLFYSDETLQRTVKEGVYFVCEEASHEMVEVTRYMIRYNKLKFERANAERIEKATDNAVKLSSIIERIKDDYSVKHLGKKPSLHTIADILNEENVKSPGGKGKWIAVTVKRIIEKSESLSRASR